MTTWTKPHHGKTNEWLTPKYIIDAVGPFNTDPCAAENQPYPTAKIMFTKKQDGLSKAWSGFTWLNPPFGSETKQWLMRMADHGHGIALTFARTDTQWFHEYVFEKAKALFFLKGRPKFMLPDGKFLGNSGGAIVLAGYGGLGKERLFLCDLPGVYIPLS